MAKENKEVKSSPKPTKITSVEELKTKLDAVAQVSGQKGERFYARKFKELYNSVRKSLVLLAKARGNALTSEETYSKAISVLYKYIPDEYMEIQEDMEIQEE